MTRLSRRQNFLIASIYLTVSLVMFAASAWVIMDIWRGSGIVDRGSRLLVIMTTGGTDRPHELIVRSQVLSNWDLSVTVYAQAEGLAEAWETIPVDLDVTFAGVIAGWPEITCGTDVTLASESFDTLSPGAQRAVRADLYSPSHSALDFSQNPDDVPALQYLESVTAPRMPDESILDDVQYGTYHAALSLLSTEHHATARWLENDTVWAENCIIPSEYVWRVSRGTIYEMSSHRTLLVPQFNFISSSGDSSGIQQSMFSDLFIDRMRGYTVFASYPELTPRSNSWSLDLGVWETEGLWYTDQPSVILENRDSAARQELILLALGAGAGAAGTLFALGARRILYLLIGRTDGPP